MRKKTKQIGGHATKALPATQSKSNPRARAGGKKRDVSGAEGIIVSCMRLEEVDAVRLTPDEYQAVKAFAPSRGLSMAESVKLDAVRSACIAGFQAGAEPGAVTIRLQHEDGRAWCQFDMPAETFERLERVCAAQGVTVPSFIREAVLNKFGRETAGAGGSLGMRAEAADRGASPPAGGSDSALVLLGPTGGEVCRLPPSGAVFAALESKAISGKQTLLEYLEPGLKPAFFCCLSPCIPPS